MNTELIDLYLQVGEYISRRVNEEDWGKGIVRNLSEYINNRDASIKGFSPQNLWRMKQFFEIYEDDQKLSPLVRELSWSNNLIIMSRTKSREEREFYLRLSKKEHYSKRELDRQISSSKFEITMLSGQKLSPLVREIHPKLESAFRDTYVLDFLNLPEVYVESDLRKAIIRNLKKFILEFGKDFTFVGEEYRVQVGNQDFFIDLVFFNRDLQCLVAIDLKTQKFGPEFVGKMNFYLESLDRDVKKDHENPSVGIILCKDKDNEVVEYAMSRNISPTLVAEYETKLIDKNQLRAKLHELFELSEEEIFEEE